MNVPLPPLRDVAAALAPSRFPWFRFLAALALGWCGGYLFASLNLPLPWMLGSMSVLTLASILRLPLAAPPTIRPPMSAIIGVMLGSSFRPEVIGQLPNWIATLAGLALFVVVSGAACVWYLHRIAGYDRATAYFAGMPGGLVEMTEASEHYGADQKAVAPTHSARILLIVFTLPFLVQWLEGVGIGDRSRLGLSVLEAPWASELMLVGCALAGAMLGRVLDLPARYLLGPMIVSAIVHTSGVSDFVPPREIVNAAQLVLGTVIGCRFVGTRPATILRILAVSVGSTVILIALTLGFAALVGRVSGHGLVPLVLAYSPGGLAEMSLVALAIHTEVAFVAAHHIVRILLVMTSAGPAFRLFGYGAPGPAVPPDPGSPAESALAEEPVE